MKKKIALITGVTGQDGSYLSELLLNKNYIVYGLCRRVSYFNRNRIEHLRNNKRFKLIYGDLSDYTSLESIIKSSKPDEIYNLGAQSHVQVSFSVPEFTAQVNALGILRILECVKNLNLTKKTKIYQASTSEMYGNSTSKTIDEKTSFKPVSPYGAAKLYGFNISSIYRSSYNIFISNGILFNHESHRRGYNFISKKIINGVVDILEKKIKYIKVGNLNAYRDWGSAKEYVYAMWKMLQLKNPDDYIISTNKSYSVKYFINKSFKLANINLKWSGKGINEVGKDQNNIIRIKISKKYIRPNELHRLKGSYGYALKKLNWKPKTSLNDLISEMLAEELISRNIDLSILKK